MKKLLITASGLCTEAIKKAFFELLPEKFSNLNIGIVTTSQPKLKEKHPKMILVKNTFHEMGFKNVEFIDIEFDNINKLRKFDIIFLNGGYPLYLSYHLKVSGADIVLKELIDSGIVFIGASAGSMVLGPDNNICNYFYPEDNTFGVTDFSALNATDIIIYPHYEEHCRININLAEKISEFEFKYNCEVTRLNNDQAILVLGNKVYKIGYSKRETYVDKTPSLKLILQANSFEAVKGEQSWTIHKNNDDDIKSEIIPKGISETIVIKESNTVTIPAKATILLSFNNKPSNITVNIYKDNKPIKQEIIEGKIKIPELKGSIMYEIVANWNNATVSYRFSVNVN